MAANKRKQDEKHLKMLREMVALAHNKQCFDCHQRGPTYVNMTTGAFVCTSCSGMLRGLNPPHRVKSISMTSFTTDEMEFLRSRGNDFCRRVWLGLYDSRSHMEPDSKDETKIKDFMCQKYEKKRWYVTPTEAMHEEARKQNTPEKKETAAPLRSLTGDGVPGLKILNQNPGISKPIGTIQKPVSKPNTTPTQPQPPSNLAPASKAGVPDLLGELGNDPFANPSPAAQTTTPGGGFADFSSFNSQTPSSSAPSGFPGPPAAPSGGAFLQALGSTAPSSSSPAFPAFTASLSTSTATTTSTPAVLSQGDRYAALADLDSVFGGGSGGGHTVNWDGSIVGSHSNSGNAGGGQAGMTWMGGAGTPSGSAGGGGGAPGGVNTNVFGGVAGSPAGANMPGGFGAPDPWRSHSADQITNTSNNPFLVSNPFGSSQPTVASSVSNPFISGGGGGGGGQPAPANFAAFSQAATMQQSTSSGFAQFGQTSTPSSSQAFGGFGQTQTSTATPAGQFGMQNGGGIYGANQAAGWGFPSQAAVGGFGAGSGFGGAGMPAGQFAQKQGQPAFGMPQQAAAPAGFASWGSQPAGNPFMSMGQGQAIPPRSNSTNPFL